MTSEDERRHHGYWKPYKVKYYHATTQKVYDAMVHTFTIGGLRGGNVIYIPVIEVEIDGVLHKNLEVWYPCKIIPEGREK